MARWTILVKGSGPVLSGSAGDADRLASTLVTQLKAAGHTIDSATLAVLSSTMDLNPSGAKRHARCGWIGAGDTSGEAAFVANASYYHCVHPKWFQLDAGLNIVPAGTPDSAPVVAAALANGVRVMPLIDCPQVGGQPVWLRTLINDPAKRTAHAAAVAALCKAHGYAGIELDYEHLWTAADRAPFSALIGEVAAAVHAIGVELCLAVPCLNVVYANNGYDYKALSAAADTLHIMNYDRHGPWNDHRGPLAPLGWVEDGFKNAQATGHPERFMLGLANYGYRGDGSYATPRQLLSEAPGPIDGTDAETAGCPMNELTPKYGGGRAPHFITAKGTTYCEDLLSMEEKLKLATAYKIRGCTYWVIGDELPGFFDLVRRYFP